jgi:hypothetical protein
VAGFDVLRNRKTLWGGRLERPFAGSRPPAALFFYSPDRKGAHPKEHLFAA